MPEFAPYSASKHALIGLARSAALEYAGRVRVNCVCPATTDTPMVARFAQQWPEWQVLIPPPRYTQYLSLSKPRVPARSAGCGGMRSSPIRQPNSSPSTNVLHFATVKLAFLLRRPPPMPNRHRRPPMHHTPSAASRGQRKWLAPSCGSARPRPSRPGRTSSSTAARGRSRERAGLTFAPGVVGEHRFSNAGAAYDAHCLMLRRARLLTLLDVSNP